MGPFPLVVKTMSRGSSPTGSAAQAARILLLGGFAVLCAAGLGCGREKKSDEMPVATAAEMPGPKQPAGATGQAGGKAGKARNGKTETGKVQTRKAEAGKAETGNAEAGNAVTGKAEAGKRGKKGAPPPPARVISDVPVSSLSDEQVAAQVEALRRENARLGSEVAALEPTDPYILINTTLNRLSMKRGDAYILKDAVVSTGSNTELVDTKGDRRWFFSTPKGVRTVKKKMIAPVWVKPDWAFVEEGEPVPGAQAEARFEEGTLGKYGLYFGNGYLVHGTLFQRFLGQSVTHGCVRVGDADIETIYMNASVGTKIYIY
jgi:L,D-transpeptidase YbiS